MIQYKQCPLLKFTELSLMDQLHVLHNNRAYALSQRVVNVNLNFN